MLYGAKLGLALHWAETGKILPNAGRVGVIWYTNEVQYLGGVPQHLFEMLPEQRMLRQGKKTSAYPFSFSSGKATDTDATAHWACFSDAFMYYLFVGQTIDFSILPPDHLFSPGCLQTPKPRPVARGIDWGIGPEIFSSEGDKLRTKSRIELLARNFAELASVGKAAIRTRCNIGELGLTPAISVTLLEPWSS